MTKPFDTGNTNAPNSGVPRAKVIVQPIVWDATGTTLVQDPTTYNNGVFTDYIIESHFENSKQIYMNGVAAPGGFNGQTAVFTQLTASTMLLVVDWSVCKTGTKPQVPNPTSKDPNWEFLYELYEPNMIDVDGKGNSPIYRLSGCYVYGAKNGNKSQSDYLSWPIAPWIDSSVDRSFETSLFTDNLATKATTGGSVGGSAGAPGFFVQGGG